MDKLEVKSVTLSSPDATEKLGENIGHYLKGGEVIELISDLGGGKTTLARGISRGAGSRDHVTSPSFTIRNDYQAKNVYIAHFDFYRLSDPGILRDLLAETIADPKTSVIIEWGQIVDDVLPKRHIKIELKTTSEESRKAEISYAQKFDYLFKDLS